ncbi:hypothetical protein TIFTF001_006586 [Ficus carica]|uniref:Uncharacterized protein n=1 Tax=Ficus carica TaxID=3494 RepID=A0AA88A4G8_FICCA|nr:hypothetical protein TIFTF001_006586 [Ficus carica]
MASVCCSIELEPRTLRGRQLNHAREEAADVVRKLKAHEATIMFIEGSRPVSSIKKMKQIIEDEEEEGEEEDGVVGCMTSAQIIEIPCQCACSTAAATTSTESLEQDQPIIRQPLSAPF